MATKNSIPLTQERLRELLHYDEATGIFTWIKQVGSRGVIGCNAGTPHGNGYISIQIDRTLYYGHRLAWLYVYKAWPKKEIDHIDGNRTNNSLINLREASRSENNQNLKRARSDNKSNLLGAKYIKSSGKYHARIKIEGKEKHLGSFMSAELAHKAYVDAKRIHHTYGTI